MNRWQKKSTTKSNVQRTMNLVVPLDPSHSVFHQSFFIEKRTRIKIEEKFRETAE